MKFIHIIVLVLIQSVLVVMPSYATKTSDTPLNFTVLFTDFRLGQMSMYSPGQPVSYNLTLENATKASYWGVDYVVTFPDAVTCTSASAPKNCSLVGNRFSCHWGDVYGNDRFNFVVNCQVKPSAVCGSNARTIGSATTMKAATNNQGFLDFQVKCLETPTPTSTSTPVPTVVPPTATYTATATHTATYLPTYTATFVPTHTATYTPTGTSTPASTATVVPTSTPYVTYTPTPAATRTPSQPECKDGVDNDNDGKTDYPSDPGCESPHDSDEGQVQDCATYSIEREVYERWSRSNNKPVSLRERVQILPEGESLACLRSATTSGSGQCLKYDEFNSCNDFSLKRQLRRESYGSTCFGPSSLTTFLLNQACEQDRSSRECEQFLALNAYQSNDYPLEAHATGVELCQDHNPRFQLFVIDRDCRLIRNPSQEQELESCPAAVITGYTYSQNKRY